MPRQFQDLVLSTFWMALYSYIKWESRYHGCLPWNQGANWSELGSIPARRETSLDRNHSTTASLLGGLAVWNSEWAVGPTLLLLLLLLSGLQTEQTESVWAKEESATPRTEKMIINTLACSFCGKAMKFCISLYIRYSGLYSGNSHLISSF